MGTEVTFYTHPQSRARIVHWMLEELGCPYTIKVLEYGTTMKAPEYLAINPMGKVPAIRHGEQVVTEGAAICTYLAEAFPEAGLLPEAAHRGAYYRWLFFAAACLEPAMNNHAVGWNPDPATQGRFGYGTYERVIETLAAWLKGRSFVAGERFSAADVYVASMLGFGMRFKVIEARTEFEAYATPLLARPARLRAEAQAEALLKPPA